MSQKQSILITACSMEVGGIERSLAGMLDIIDYERFDVDLLLFSKKGEFLPLLNPKCNVLPEIPQCATLLKGIKQTFFSGHALMAAARVYSALKVRRRYKNSNESEDAVVYAILQAYWDNSIAFMPKLKKEYDTAVSFMWPHHFVAKNVRAKQKLAWIHTDYTKLALDRAKDEQIWRCFNTIAAVSNECAQAFASVYPSLADKTITVENYLSAQLIRSQAEDFTPPEMKKREGVTRILTTGRFCYAKAFDVAVDICKILIDSGEKIVWYAVGYGTELENVKKMVDGLGLNDQFVILGKKINPYPYMKNCDIYVQPSRYEGKALTVREAQILGKPVIITNFTTARGQVRDGFDAIISPMEPKEVANDIVRLINDGKLRDTLARNAYNSDWSSEHRREEINALLSL